MGGTGQLAQQNERAAAHDHHLVAVFIVDHQVGIFVQTFQTFAKIV